MNNDKAKYLEELLKLAQSGAKKPWAGKIIEVKGKQCYNSMRLMLKLGATVIVKE